MKFYSSGKYIENDNVSITYTPETSESGSRSPSHPVQWDSVSSRKAVTVWKRKQAEKEEHYRRQQMDEQSVTDEFNRHQAKEREQLMNAKPWRTEDFIPPHQQYGHHIPDVRRKFVSSVGSNFELLKNSNKKGANFRSGRDGLTHITPY